MTELAETENLPVPLSNTTVTVAVDHTDTAEVEGRVREGPRSFEPIQPTAEPDQCGKTERNKRPSPPVPHKADFAIQWNIVKGPLSEAAGHLREYAPKIIAFYMTKGGVGKTSTTLSVGHALARNGITTMMVDLDPQQDLTEQCFWAATFNTTKDDVQDYLDEQMPKGVAAQTCSNLKDSMRYVLGKPRPTIRNNCNPNALLVPYAFPVRAGDGTVVPNLFHVQGGLDFDEAEAQIHARMKRAEEHINIPGALFHAIWNAGKKCNSGAGADAILLDLSSALGTTTELSVMHSHYVIVPCENNRLSENHLVSLPRHIKDWYLKYGHTAPTHRTGLRDFSRGLTLNCKPNRHATLPLPDIEPKFLGIILNKYEVGRKGTKRSNNGVPEETRETFKSHAQSQMASKMLAASIRVSEELKASASSMPGDEGIELAVNENIFSSAEGDGLNVFRHKRSTAYHPQYGILARVREGAQHYSATFPFSASAIDSDVELRDVKEECNSNKSTIDKEEVAHFRRIFDDIARFIMYLPNPEPFNFVFDPNALGAREAERANELLRPFVVQGYPEVDDYQGEHVNAKRSARQVPVAFWKDWT